MFEKTIRILSPIAWVIIMFVIACEGFKYMFIFHQDLLEAIYPLLIVAWVVFLFTGREILARCINSIW